ncbi:adaptin N terminal region-domain-containing protein [Sparassis latifolia]
MASLNLSAISENASRLGMRLQETLSEHTRDLARGSTSAYLDSPDEKVKNIRRQLDSNSEREKLDAMKRLIALISKGRNVSEFFAQVVKNVASQNLEIRKLVYIYLLRYAEQEPDLALLSINTFQKDLSDPSPLIRAMALRVLSGIQVPMIGSIVILAIKKCAADISPYVRKAAALAIPKCFSLDSNRQPELISIIATLWRDHSPLSLGGVAVAFGAVCPTRLDLLHQHYRRLCRTLVDVDEWGQVDLLNILVRYARTMLPRPHKPQVDSEYQVDEDLNLLLKSSEPLLLSQNAAVVVAVSRAFYFLAPPPELSKLISPLLRLLHISPEVERVVLGYLMVASRSLPHVLAPYYCRFLVRAQDVREVKRDKVRLLRAVLSMENYQSLLREFIVYTDDADDEVVSDTIQAIGYCARSIPEATQQCLTALMSFIRSKNDVVVAHAVIVLKSLIQMQLRQEQPNVSTSASEIIARLAYHIEDIHHPKARACVFWLAGQYASTGTRDDSLQREGLQDSARWAPDLLRKSAKSFSEEAPVVKLQVMTLAAKLLTLSPAHRTIGFLNRYIFSMARYDSNFDVRDRARTLASLMAGVSSGLYDGGDHEEQGGVVLRREQVRMVLFAGKVDPSEDTVVNHINPMSFGSLAAITGKDSMVNDAYLPDWLEEGTESSLRDTEDDASLIPSLQSSVGQPSVPYSVAPIVGPSSIVLTPSGPSPAGSYVVAGSKAPWTDLDKFYEESTDNDDEDVESEESDGGENRSDEDVFTESEGSSSDTATTPPPRA